MYHMLFVHELDAQRLLLPPADLRRALVRKLKCFITPAGAVLGDGTFGSVIELTSAGETVAIGRSSECCSQFNLHAIADRISTELIMMAQFHHTKFNIVQCKGVSLLVDQPLPVLLIERLMNSLHAYLLHLDNSNGEKSV